MDKPIVDPAIIETLNDGGTPSVTGNTRILQEVKTTQTEEETQNAGRESVQS